MKIQNLYKEFKKQEAEVERREAAFEADWENEELEAENDRFYDEVFYPAYQALIDEVRRLTGVDVPVAKKMINSAEFGSLMGMTVVG